MDTDLHTGVDRQDVARPLAGVDAQHIREQPWTSPTCLIANGWQCGT